MALFSQRCFEQESRSTTTSTTDSIELAGAAHLFIHATVEQCFSARPAARWHVVGRTTPTTIAPSELQARSSCPFADVRDKVIPPGAQAPKVNNPPFPLYGHSKSIGRKGQRRDRVRALKIGGSRERRTGRDKTAALIHQQQHTKYWGVLYKPFLLEAVFPLTLRWVAFFLFQRKRPCKRSINQSPCSLCLVFGWGMFVLLFFLSFSLVPSTSVGVSFRFRFFFFLSLLGQAIQNNDVLILSSPSRVGIFC